MLRTVGNDDESEKNRKVLRDLKRKKTQKENMWVVLWRPAIIAQ